MNDLTAFGGQFVELRHDLTTPAFDHEFPESSVRRKFFRIPGYFFLRYFSRVQQREFEVDARYGS